MVRHVRSALGAPEESRWDDGPEPIDPPQAPQPRAFQLPRKKSRHRGEVRKQVGLYLPVSDWLLLRDEALRRGLPMTQLIAGEVERLLQTLRENAAREQAS